METKIVDAIDPSKPKVEMKPKKAHFWIILYDKIKLLQNTDSGT